MSNSTREANIKLFQPILEQANVYGKVHNKHCLIFPEDSRAEEIAFFEHLTILKDDTIIHGKKFVLLEYKKDGEQQKKFLVTINIFFEEDIEFDTSLASVNNEYLSSFFLCLSSQGIVEMKKEDLEDFYDARLYADEDHGSFSYYTGQIRKHNLEEIKSYFNNFTVFELTESGPFYDVNVHKVLLYILCQQEDMRWLPYENKVIDKFENLAISGHEEIPYHFILDALISLKWKYVFKDLYRCIERLYPISKIQDLQKSLACIECTDSFGIANALEKNLSWKAQEQSSFSALLSKVEFNIIEEIVSILIEKLSRKVNWSDELEILDLKNNQLIQSREGKKLKEKLCSKICDCNGLEVNGKNIEELEKEIEVIEKTIKDKKIEFVSKELYMLRNSFVHYREYLTKESEKYDFKDNDWNHLILQILMIIDDIYEQLM